MNHQIRFYKPLARPVCSFLPPRHGVLRTLYHSLAFSLLLSLVWLPAIERIGFEPIGFERTGIAYAQTPIAQNTATQGTSATLGAIENGYILIKFKEGTSEDEQVAIRHRHQLGQISEMGPLPTHLLAVTAGAERTLVQSLNQEPLVEYAEPDYLYHALGVGPLTVRPLDVAMLAPTEAPTEASTEAIVGTVAPNDEFYELQWGLGHIGAPDAWSTTTGSSNVIIAVVDTGIELSHPDLLNKLVAGATFVRRTSTAEDDLGHGTHVASIAASSANNGIGVTGLSWDAKLMPVKVLNQFGSGRISDIAAGIVWSVDNGADIINLSLGGTEDSNSLRDAVDYAESRGVLVIAAVGNEYESGSPTSYPAAYDSVLAVGAIDADDHHASFSSSANYIDVVAPGVEILGAVPSNLGVSYESYSGTSMATPFVSGLAALLLSINPNLNNDQLRALIRDTSVDVESSGWDELTGFGRIDAAAAVTTAQMEIVDGGGSMTPALYLPLLMQ